MNQMKRPRITTAVILLLASILACNVPSAEQVPPPGDVQTSAALTVAAILTPSATATEQQQSILPITPSPTPTSTIAATRTITPTFSVPMLTVREQTNCRKGPGQEYEVVFTYLPNKKLQIIGRYDPGNFWLVKSPESPTGECWLWGEYVEITGSYWVVSSVTPPPTATKAPPAAPSIQKWDFACSAGQMSITIEWTDRAVDETGYRVIRDDGIAAELPANSTKYNETIPLESGESVTYYIEVYTGADTVRSSPIKLTC